MSEEVIWPALDVELLEDAGEDFFAAVQRLDPADQCLSKGGGEGWGEVGKERERGGGKGEERREKEEERGGWESVGVKCFWVKMKTMQQ